MTTNRKMIVRVVARTTKQARLVLKSCPTWSGILGEEVEINLMTAQKKGGGYVHFRGSVLTGPRTGSNLTISTAILDLMPDQYRLIESLIDGEATAATAA